LGFKPYVDAVAEFLRSEDTKPPLTLSIEGEWGSGKSSFMGQLRIALIDGGLLKLIRKAWSEEPKISVGTIWPSMKRLWKRAQRRTFTVQFNPWRHDKEESLWATFALEFLRQVSEQRFFLWRWSGAPWLFALRYRWKKGWLQVVRAISIWSFSLVLLLGLPSEIFIAKPAWTSNVQSILVDGTKVERQSLPRPAAPSTTTSKPENEEDSWIRVLLAIFGSSLTLTMVVWFKAKGIIGNALETDLTKYLSRPDY
jgi:hypothetical protein